MTTSVRHGAWCGRVGVGPSPAAMPRSAAARASASSWPCSTTRRWLSMPERTSGSAAAKSRARTRGSASGRGPGVGAAGELGSRAGWVTGRWLGRSAREGGSVAGWPGVRERSVKVLALSSPRCSWRRCHRPRPRHAQTMDTPPPIPYPCRGDHTVRSQQGEGPPASSSSVNAPTRTASTSCSRRASARRSTSTARRSACTRKGCG